MKKKRTNLSKTSNIQMPIAFRESVSQCVETNNYFKMHNKSMRRKLLKKKTINIIALGEIGYGKPIFSKVQNLKSEA